jgi:hypothetical protein
MSREEVIVRGSEEGGFALFRCFSPPDRRDKVGHLRGLVMSRYRWKPGRNKSDEPPTLRNTNGLWGFKTLALALSQEGAGMEHSGIVFGLTEGFGKYVIHETGLRTQYARIRAFIRPTRERAKASFPEKSLGEVYPKVPIIHQHQIDETIEELRLLRTPYEKPYPLMQWFIPAWEPEDEEDWVDAHPEMLVWADVYNGPFGSDEATASSIMLEPAASFEGYVHSDDQRLIKTTLKAADGERYAFWGLLGEDHETTPDLAQLLHYEREQLEDHRIKGSR